MSISKPQVKKKKKKAKGNEALRHTTCYRGNPGTTELPHSRAGQYPTENAHTQTQILPAVPAGGVVDL